MILLVRGSKYMYYKATSRQLFTEFSNVIFYNHNSLKERQHLVMTSPFLFVQKSTFES